MAKTTAAAASIKSPLWAKIFVFFGALLMVSATAVGGYAKYMIDTVNDSVGSDDLLNNGESGEPIEGPLNILLIGSDKREDWDSAQSDTVMIAHVNEDLTKAHIVSIPRDLYVEIAGTDCGGGTPCQDKLNSAFTKGGKSAAKSVQSLAQTLDGLIGISFDDAVMINFQGFSKLVDLFGSVELCLPFDMEVKHSKNEKYELGPNGGRMYPKGCKEYGKKDALPIVRERYAYDPAYSADFDPDWGIGDYGRQRMQQHFVKQLLKKAKEEGYITDPTKVTTLIKEIGDNILMDDNHSPVDYATSLSNVDPGKITTLKVPSQSSPTDVGSAVVIKPGEQEQAAAELWEALRNDTLDDWADDHPEWVNKDT